MTIQLTGQNYQVADRDRVPHFLPVMMPNKMNAWLKWVYASWRYQMSCKIELKRCRYETVYQKYFPILFLFCLVNHFPWIILFLCVSMCLFHMWLCWCIVKDAAVHLRFCWCWCKCKGKGRAKFLHLMSVNQASLAQTHMGKWSTLVKNVKKFQTKLPWSMVNWQLNPKLRNMDSIRFWHVVLRLERNPTGVPVILPTKCDTCSKY